VTVSGQGTNEIHVVLVTDDQRLACLDHERRGTGTRLGGPRSRTYGQSDGLGKIASAFGAVIKGGLEQTPRARRRSRNSQAQQLGPVLRGPGDEIPECTLQARPVERGRAVAHQMHRVGKARRILDDGNQLGDVGLGRDAPRSAPGIDHICRDLTDDDPENDNCRHQGHDPSVRPARGREALPSPARSHRGRS